MNYQLLALDMDGTALAPDTSMTAVTREAISEALDAGVTVVFCSGRCREEIKEFTDLFPKMRYVICENGVYTVDLQTGCYVDFTGLERWLADRIMAEAEKYDVFIQLGANGRYYIQENQLGQLERYGLGKYYGLLSRTGGLVSDLRQFYREYTGEVSKINFYFSNPADRAKVIETFQAEKLPLNYASGLSDNVEMSVVAATKGAGLQALGDHLGIGPEQVMAIGDNSNDITMLEAAGFPVAMDNAIPEVKAICKAVTEDNGHDGVAAAIRRYVL